ncbi:MAG TPA: hypothetical protein DCX06_03380 [Opitutae bacterium]|nr:hypothetical protein [Opitutae bacterium]
MNSESTRSSRRSQSSASRSKSQITRFIPNLTQLQSATKQLPDAELWPEDTCLCPIDANGKRQTIEFTRKQIKRGKERPYRWIYKGKVLIRNRDIPEDS